LNLISQAELGRVESCLATLLPKSTESHGLEFFVESIRSFVLAGGKRIRPQLCLWTFAHTGGPLALAPAAMKIACAWELFHAFLLIHDDLIDDADSRRDQPSLHRRFEEQGGLCDKTGRDLAVVAGDLLFSAALDTLHDIDLSPALYRRELRLFSRVALTTGLGQALDIVQAGKPVARACEKTLLREYHWKTAAYTFEGPMLSGAVLAGADEDILSVLSCYALALGQAYQLQNDLFDLASPAHEGCDLVQGKRTVTLLRARSAMNQGDRRRLDEILEELPNANGQAVALAEELRRNLLRSGAPQQTQALIDQFLAEARQASRAGCLPRPLATGLGELLDSLESQYFTPV